MSDLKKPLAIAVGAALAASLAGMSTAGADTPFTMESLSSGYMAADAGEGKCGGDKGEEGKCGGDKGEEGKCGGDKEGADEKGEEGKCGEGHSEGYVSCLTH